MRRTVVLSSLLIFAGLVLIACGTTATEPRPTFEPTSTFDFRARIANQETRVAQAEAERPDDDGVAVADADSDNSDNVDAVAPSATPIPATPTSVPPTATPEPTIEPTEVVAEEQTLQDLYPDLPEDASPSDGKILFEIIANEAEQRCMTCHEVNEPITGQGPYLYGIANRAGERVEGQSPVEYLHTSIVNPNAYIVELQGDQNYNAGVMPQNWTEFLSDDDIYDIVAYLLTLDQE